MYKIIKNYTKKNIFLFGRPRFQEAGTGPGSRAGPEKIEKNENKKKIGRPGQPTWNTELLDYRITEIRITRLPDYQITG